MSAPLPDIEHGVAVPATLTAAHLADGVDQLVLLPTPADGDLYLQDLDLGFPDIRDVTANRPDADGTDDRTAHFGARAVTVTLVAFTPAAVDRLRAWLRPNRRPWLIVTAAGQTPRKLQLRAAQASAPLAALKRRTHIEISAQWRAPTGRLLSTDEYVEAANPTAAETGRTYPLVFPRTYPSSSGAGTVVVVNDGNVDTDPTIRIFGPCTDPRIDNAAVGRALEFAGLTVAGGDYLELDAERRTVRLNGDPAQSRYRYLDFEQSAWWPLIPGPNLVRFYPASSSPPCVAEIRHHHAWL